MLAGGHQPTGRAGRSAISRRLAGRRPPANRQDSRRQLAPVSDATSIGVPASVRLKDGEAPIRVPELFPARWTVMFAAYQ
jgi:hypothetical protein